MHPLIHITDSFALPTYLVFMSLIYSISIIWIFIRSKKLNLNPKIAMDISIAIMIGGLIGARLAHVFYEHLDYYMQYPQEIYKVWNGGFVFYGGLIGGFLSSYIYVIQKKEDPLQWMDAFAPLLAIGYGIGRLGCLFAGCCFGRECDLPWAIRYPEGVEAPAHILLHPTPLYDFLLSVLAFGVLFLVEKYRFKFAILQKHGSLFYLWMVFYAVQRIIVEDFRNDFRGPALAGLSISTIVSVLLLITGSVLLFRSRRLR